jgi:uncharacterized protein (DUF1697 family)
MHIALLRGINVGGKNNIPMKDLQTTMQRLGCANVQTVIQSGNVVFQLGASAAKTIGRQLSDQISASHGFAPQVTVLTTVQLVAAIEKCPFVCQQGSQLHLFFLDQIAKSPDLAALSKFQAAREEFRLQDSIFYLHAPDGIGRSKLAANLGRCLGVSATARNWNTMLKIQTLAGQRHF